MIGLWKKLGRDDQRIKFSNVTIFQFFCFISGKIVIRYLLNTRGIMQERVIIEVTISNEVFEVSLMGML